MFRRLNIFLLVFYLILLTGCVRETDEDALRTNIGELLVKYQQGVNNLDRGLLETVISDKFSFYEKDRDAYINELLSMTVLIDKIHYGNIRVENYKIFADVQTEGSSIFRPSVPIPLFKTVPFMNGKLRSGAVFAFLYEEQEGLKILAEDQVLTEKEIVWGEQSPVILNPKLSRYRVAPGDLVDVSFQVNKSGNDIIFAFVNERMLGGYALGENTENNVEYAFKVPAELRRGESVEIQLQVFGGKMDLNNPQEAVLKGAAVRSYVLPVR